MFSSAMLSNFSHSNYFKGYYQAINNLKTNFIRGPKNNPQLSLQESNTQGKKLVS